MAHLEQGQDLQEQPIVDANGNIVSDNNNSSSQPPNKGKFGPKQIALIGAALVVVAMAAFMLLRNKPEEGTSDSSSTSSTVDDSFIYPVEQSSSLSVPDGFIEPSASTDPYEYSNYTAEDVKTLRGLGYTGDEIEYYAQQGKSINELIQDAYAAKDAAEKEWRESVLDGASDEYKALMDKTFLGNNQTKDSVQSGDITIGYNLTENIDYERIGVYNYQAWIKVYLSYGAIFMNIPIERYSELPDSGNIVVSYTARCDKNDTLLEITNLKEVTV